MNVKRKKRGFSLPETIVVMGVIGLLAGIGVPAVKGVLASFESSDRVRDVIGAALSSGRAIAIKEQKYAGVRFQRDLAGDQYMIFIVHDQAATDLAYGFRSVIGRNPVRLPRGGGVMDLRLRTKTGSGEAQYPDDEPIASDGQIDSDEELRDTTTFSVVFSPSGKLVTHEVRVRGTGGGVFGDSTVVDAGNAMFYHDYYPAMGLGQEPSRNRFVVFNRSKFSDQPFTSRWTGYLGGLQTAKEVYINPYNGQLISR
ncbi:MAG: prepilin-type N-terminal cleavage/methylation domain-containing protein [Planctomycetes bacterium]|nr:prepilin-type N-terminal cleavage/methylation domain-containing protein [Planctomycetota bacterium]